MKYEIPEFGIIVETFQVAESPETGMHIKSNLKKVMGPDDPKEYAFELDGAVNALESLILGHACAGLDIAAPAYVEGLRSCLEALGNHYS
jgi:hypothetical protein